MHTASKREIINLCRCTQLLISGKYITQYTSYSLIFNLHITQCYKTKNSTKSISTINRAITKKRDIFDCLSVPQTQQLLIEKWVCCSVMPLYHYTLLPAIWTHWITVQAKNSIRNAPASAVLTLVSHQSHNVHTTNCHLRSKKWSTKEIKGKLW